MGCGFGYLPLMLNLVSINRQITGVDYDTNKISVATNCAIKNDNLNFITADITKFEPEYSDIFIINDVLHYMPEYLQIIIVESCIKKLNNNGQIIIRDADKDLKKRHKGTKITELLSTNIGFNKTQFKLEFVSHSMIESIANNNNLNLQIIDNTKRTSNLIYILRN